MAGNRGTRTGTTNTNNSANKKQKTNESSSSISNSSNSSNNSDIMIINHTTNNTVHNNTTPMNMQPLMPGDVINNRFQTITLTRLMDSVNLPQTRRKVIYLQMLRIVCGTESKLSGAKSSNLSFYKKDKFGNKTNIESNYTRLFLFRELNGLSNNLVYAIENKSTNF